MNLIRDDKTTQKKRQVNLSRRIALVGVYAALVLVAAYVLVYIPNVELVTCLLFVGGYCFGIITGSFIAVVVSVIFSNFNPLGSTLAAFPLLFVFQIIFYLCIAILGGVIGQMRHRQQFTISPKTAVTLGLLGFCITLAFDIGSTFAMYLPITDGNWIAVWSYWVAGIVFTILHLAFNPLVFAFLLPVVANAIIQNYGISFDHYKTSSRILEKGDIPNSIAL
ncbi:MAG: hypothetical protein RBG13Loki_3788 [Promethearchaeota archaeon CR_4]|nr:MAG: hypothetical protein RBG13Loki_3788 [Candidatus Lokiarchaeota archaeon CR_4]